MTEGSMGTGLEMTVLGAGVISLDGVLFGNGPGAFDANLTSFGAFASGREMAEWPSGLSP